METGWLKNIALGEYLRKNNYSNQFIVHHIIPMGSAVWSMPTDSMLEFPAESFIGFLNNHGLMSLSGAPKWRTVIGGSHEYVKKILKTLSGEVFTQRSVTSVKRKENSVAITTEHGETIEYNKVVIATHADEALQILADPSPDEKKLLGPWRYNNNRTILHTDDSVMPQNKKVWSSWNFTREKLGDRSSLCLTYHMNRLQGLGTEHQYFVTLNTRKELDKRKIILEMDHYHPQYSMESMTAQKDLPALNGHKNTYYCGSYFGYGFHEDAVRSSVVVANLLGLKL